MMRVVTLILLTGLINACSTSPIAGSPGEKSSVVAAALTLPIHYTTLDNGLRVVVSEDHSVPTATVAVYYNIGFRIEPRERTGFAHLFEHMMFQGSENLGKMEFINLVQSNGGVLNGSTRFDYTNYYEVVPANKVETMLWAEADRMKGLAITEDNLTNQKGVVKNEVKVNVLNQPYGGFPWLDVPAYANENWYNNHNFYGDLEDLDAATVEDVQDFFKTYYAPNNAVVVVVGAVETDEVMNMITRHFGDIEPSVLPPPVDISEPRQEEEKRVVKVYPKAPQPALAVSYHMPQRNSPEYYAMGIITEILLSGKDSRFYKKLVKEAGITSSVSGGVNLIGNMYNYNGPMNWHMSLIHDPKVTADDIMVMVDEVIEDLRNRRVSRDDIELARTQMRSGFYDMLGSPTKFGVVDLLACFTLFDDDPGRINRLEQEFDSVTPELIQRTAQEYLRPTNRLVLEVTNGKDQTEQGAAQ